MTCFVDSVFDEHCVAKFFGISVKGTALKLKLGHVGGFKLFEAVTCAKSLFDVDRGTVGMTGGMTTGVFMHR